MFKRSLLFVFFVNLSLVIYAQELPVSAAFQKAYDRQTRDMSGKPGKKYWQNHANYALDIDFNPSSRLLNGKVEIRYHNASPDNLKEIWFKLYPNLYKKGVPNKANIKAADQGDGVKITAFQIDGKTIPVNELKIDGTNMVVSTGVKAGATAKISIVYSYVSNKGSHMRTGEVNPKAHFIAYSFPRVAVYDDVDGWNKIPYSGAEEFYNDFGDFKVNIKVPGGYVVWATGDLTNSKEVLLPNIIDKLRRAEKSGAVIDVIDSNDLATGKVTVPGAFNTFTFDAKNVPDFAFALSDHYLWKSKSLVVDSTTGRRTRVDAVFNPVHKDYYEVINYAWKTVELMSFVFPKWPFPYSHETVFDGLDQMEYPMMVNDNPTETKEDAITLTDHEIFHTMFPFYMGINETKYAWMDEGWATIGEWLLSTMIDPTVVDEYGIVPTAMISGRAEDVPVMTVTTDLKGGASFTNNYPKPAFGYLFVKDLLGDELFLKALHHYIRNWNGKHPIPYDFFFSMNEGAGKNLNWFWKKWFFENGVLDMAIKDVAKVSEGYEIIVDNKGGKPMPVDLTITFADGSTTKLHHTISIWETGNTTFPAKVNTAKEITKVVLGSTYVPDRDKKDNVWTAK